MSQGFIYSSGGILLPLSVAQGGTGASSVAGALTNLGLGSTPSGTGNVILQNSPAINTPAINTPTITRPVIMGVTNGVAAIAGEVGELLDSGTTSNGFFTVNTDKNIGSLLLSAGDWDVYAQYGAYQPNFTLQITIASLSLVSNTQGSNSVQNWLSTAGNVVMSGYVYYPFNVSVATTVYLVFQATWSSGTCSPNGRIWARRRR